MEQQERKPFYKKWWVVSIITIVAVIFILGIIGSTADTLPGTQIQPSNKTEQETTKIIDEQTSAKINSSAPVAQKQYIQVFTFSGSGAKKSEPFTITGSRFKITYDCSGDLCQAFMFKVGSQIPQVVMNNVGSIRDETIMYGNGEYYLDANTMGKYNMTVSDYK